MKNFIMGYLFRAYSLLLFLLFCSFMAYQFYNRLLRERLPFDLYYPLTNFQVIIYSYILVINCCLLIFVIIYYIKSRAKPKPIGFWGKWGTKVSDFLIIHLLCPISNVYMNLIYNTIPLQYERFWIAIFNLFNDFSIPVKTAYFYIVLIVPKIIVLSCFLLDIFIFDYLYYFYKVIWLLLVPLLQRYFNYVFQFLLIYAPERIWEEMEASTAAPLYPITEEQVDHLVDNFITNMTPILEANLQAQAKIEASSWYMKIYSRFKSHTEVFRYNITPKRTVHELYSYNIRTHCLFPSMELTMLVFADIKKDIYVPLNFVLRSGYIIGWSTVLWTHMPFTEKLLEALPPLYFEAFTLWIV